MNMYVYIIVGICSSFLLCIGTILFYLKYRKNLLQKQYELRAVELQHQKDLLKAIINSQEDERKRIGMDLHDEVGSKLSSLRLTIDHYVENNSETCSSVQFNQTCKTSIDGIINNVRNISHNLSPILEGVYELSDAIYDFCDELNKSGKIKVITEVDEATEQISLPYFVKISLYRIVVELINNTIKHAEANHIFIHFFVSESIYRINYADDGKGLDIARLSNNKGMGLQNIESRLNSIGAVYQLDHTVSGGFKMEISLQL